MYRLQINGKDDIWDDKNEMFISIPGCDVLLEHSLISVSLWESKYKKSYLNSEKSVIENLDYIKMMVIDGSIDDDNTLLLLTKEQIEEIGEYINDPMTATVFSKEDEEEIKSKKISNKFVSSEEIYYWMTAQNIPFECEKWHLNRLITLIKMCAIKNKPEDKKNKRLTSSQLASRRARMEAARKKYSH